MTSLVRAVQVVQVHDQLPVLTLYLLTSALLFISSTTCEVIPCPVTYKRGADVFDRKSEGLPTASNCPWLMTPT
ncbi:MAG: hypothetical protein MZU97_07290 [Bacillus subtilis]|nr:hypothetical protein [Bacillus subtilis]